MKYQLFLFLFIMANGLVKSDGWLTPENYKKIIPSCIPEYMLYTEKRKSSYPFITGDTFRAFADFILDEMNLPFDPAQVKDGDVIFLNSHPCILNIFFNEYHSRINNKYIIITHNDDLSIPGEFGSYLDDDKIIAWFSKNVDRKHDKLIPIPIGIANPIWSEYGFCDPSLFDEAMKKIPSWDERPGYLVYLNITVASNRPGRQQVTEYFKNKNFCIWSKPKKPHEYLLDLKKYKFIISPPGHGEDCFRTWEALLMGCIPIVKHSYLDPLFDELPVILVQEWKEVTEQFLIDQYNNLKIRHFNIKKLFIDYWLEKIQLFKNNL